MSQTTKRALEASLKHLLLQKPLDKITINDIAEDCGINRMTFYYHFKDIYDLVEWSCYEDASKALAGNKTYDTWQQHCDHIRNYANHYQDYALKYVQNYFSLSDSEMNTIFGRTSSIQE